MDLAGKKGSNTSMNKLMLPSKFMSGHQNHLQSQEYAEANKVAPETEFKNEQNFKDLKDFALINKKL